MDNVATEVSKKVKSAIKAKLTELGAYVDDELPDYIMVLVANRKSKDQMDDDLSLFLGHNTERFTAWLHNVLQKLNAAAVLQVKKDDTKKEEPPPPPPPVIQSPPAPVVEIKEKKKKKDKSKKKEKKDKKKKKDKKEKKSKSSDRKPKEKSRSTSPTLKDLKFHVVNERAIAKNEKEEPAQNGRISQENEAETIVIESPKLLKRKILGSENNHEDEDDLTDVVDLRPDADDLALGLEEETLPTKKAKIEDEPTKTSSQSPSSSKKERIEEPPAKKQKELAPQDDSKGSSALQLKEEEQREDSSPEKTRPISKIIAPFREVRAISPDTPASSKVSVHDRLGPAVARRVVNVPKPEKETNLGRIASNALSSVVKSVVVINKNADGSEGHTRKLQARVRPLVSTQLKTEASEEEEDEEERPEIDQPQPAPASRIVSAVGAVLKRPRSDDELSDEEPSAKRATGLASKVEVAPRPRRAGVQANTALIMRAMADAHKSVSKLTKKVSEEKEEEVSPKKKGIFTKSYHERQKHRLNFPPGDTKTVKKIAITVPNAVKKEHSQYKENDKSMSIEETDKGKISSNSEVEEDLYDAQEQMEEASPISQALDLHMEDDLKYVPKQIKSTIKPMQISEHHPSHPRFIVTLDGFESEQSHLKARLRGRIARPPSLDEEEYIEEVEEWEEVEMEQPAQEVNPTTTPQAPSIPPRSKLKLNAQQPPGSKIAERCLFWPACKEGDACAYIHPSTMCKTFPNCSFGDKCIYIHPRCKFDTLCTKPKCPFTHSSIKRAPPPLPIPAKPAASLALSKIKCKYFPKCTDMNCPFMHPKQMCWYGPSCFDTACPYIHPTNMNPVTTNKSKLKWTAPAKSAASTDSTTPNPTTNASTTPASANNATTTTKNAAISPAPKIDSSATSLASTAPTATVS